jgi:hypothetical protein
VKACLTCGGQFEPNCWPHRYCRPECRPTHDRAALARRQLQDRVSREPERVLFDRARRAARQAGVEFCLSPKDVMVPPLCPVLGIPLNFQVRRGGGRFTPTVVRVSSRRGYDPDNVIVVSLAAARAMQRTRRPPTRDAVEAYRAWLDDLLAPVVP